MLEKPTRKQRRSKTIDTPDFFTKYFEYIGETESPAIYHRWTAISILGALLGRQVHLAFGNDVIYPNQYIMLMGSPGARKGTAMKAGKRLLKAAGYNTFAADAVSKEMFLADMGKKEDAEEEELSLETLVSDEDPCTESYVFAEEFNDFIGQGDLLFITRLTNLWDNLPEFRHPKLHGKSVYIYKPTVNIFGANTQQNLALAIPSEAIGNGFCSRMLFIHGEPTGKKITFPEPALPETKEWLIQRLLFIRKNMTGLVRIDREAIPIFDRIYKEFHPIDDHRFAHYSQRRFTHLLKICAIIAVANTRMHVTAADAINGNTILSVAERRMPKALGEFGKARNSAATSAILEHLHKCHMPQSPTDLWKVVSKDLNKFTELQEILQGLNKADKVQIVKVGSKQGYLPKNVVEEKWDNSLLNMDYLTQEEQDS